MKKTLLSVAMMALATSTTFAQMPDASKWKAGDEITDQVSWGNLSFESNPMDFWTFESSKGSTTTTGGCFEVYDGADADLYQYVQLPAGMYKVECQAYYRFGTSWDDDPKSFNNGSFENLAKLYVQNGTYDITSKEFTAGRTFKSPLMPRLFDKQDFQIYEDLVKEGWDMSDGEYDVFGEKRWGPCSVPGSLAWFNAGKYMPYDDGDGEKYNTVTFFLTEDGYARVGVSKKDAKSADSFMATNFKMYYMGEAGEAAELMALQDEVAEYYHNIEDLSSDLDGGLLYSILGDYLMEFDGEYSIDDLSAEQCKEILPEIKKFYEDAVAAKEYVSHIEGAIKLMQLLYNSTDYSGKDAFGAAIAEAQKCVDVNTVRDEENLDCFKAAYDTLVESRLAYLMTQEPINGAYNFSSAINTPFFCDNEFTPVWNEEANAYKFPTEELENTYATVQEKGYTDCLNENEGWLHICDNVKIYEKQEPGQWYIKSTTWHGGALGVTIQHSYPAIGGWTAEPTGNPEILSQTITGLPNGYYAMSALMCNAGADISDLQYVFIENGDQKEIANLTVKGNPWWGGNSEVWRSGVWEKLTTRMIQVTDGTVTIGSSSDAFYATTGFQLYYYGETPNFDELISADLLAIKSAIETDLIWGGDVKAANAIVANVPSHISSNEEYLAAVSCIKDADAYVKTAKAAYAQLNVTMANLENLVKKYDDGDDNTPASAEEQIASTAFIGALSVGEGEDDTYKMADAVLADYNAYASYLDYRAALGDKANNEAVAAVVVKHNSYLFENYADAAKISELMDELALPYNKAVFADLKADKATLDSPVDVTTLIVNPNFNEGANGWTGDMTVDSIGTPERYNTSFDIRQTIKSLPAGCYTVQVQAFYRDGGDAKTAYNNWYYLSGEEMEFWETANVKFYANDTEVPVASIASELFKDESHDRYVDGWGPMTDENGNTICDDEDNEIMFPKWVLQSDAEEGKQHDWPWDSEVTDLDEVYYYPNSVRGSRSRFEKSPEAYINKVTVMVEEGGAIVFGLKKDAGIGNDWCIFDNFKLFYLGTEAPVAVENIAATSDAASYYTVSGTKTNGAVKGINIVKMSDGSVKKIMVK